MTEEKGKYSLKAKTIFRVAKNPDNPYVMIDRRVMENPELSWKAKGLLAYLLSRPDNWVIRFRDLVKRSPDGAHTVRAAMKELRKAGHVKIETIRDGGKVKEWVYSVYERPDCDFQQVEKQQVENRTYTNNESFTNNDSYGADAPSMPLDWELTHGQTPTTLTEDQQFEREARDSANLVDFQAPGAGDLAFAFMMTRRILIPESKAKGNRKPAREMLTMHVKPEHVVQATKQLMEARDKRGKPLTIVDLFSVQDTAVGIANTAPEEKKPTPAAFKLYKPKEGRYVPNPNPKPNLARPR